MSKQISGVYKIQTPDGAVYIGSSVNIKHRMLSHKVLLRSGSHYSKSLQEQWNVNSSLVVFEILEECEPESLIAREQFWVDSFDQVHNHYKKIAERLCPVDCSNGVRYSSLCEAATAFGVRASAIKHLIKTQRTAKFGVRFKLTTDDWRTVISSQQQAYETRKLNGKLHHSEEAKAKMRAAKINFIPHNKGISHTPEAKARMAASQKRVEIKDETTGIVYESCIDAARKTGVSRTQVRRLLSKGKRFVEVGRTLPVSQRGVIA